MIYGAYLSVGLFVEGSDQEKIIFEMLHVIQVNIEHSGTLSERYQAMAPCWSSQGTLSFEKMEEKRQGPHTLLIFERVLEDFDVSSTYHV